MTELIFVRHGQTNANVVGRWQGWSDHPLTPLGQTQAQAVARRLAAERGRVAALYTSPLRRALQTARFVGAALELEPVSVDQLKEIDFGELSNITLQEMEAQHPALFARWKTKTDMTFQWPGGEQRGGFFRRAASACDRILARHDARGDEVVIVAHGGTLRACLAHLLPDQLGQWWEYELDNCGLTRVTVEEGGARLLVLNDGAHLSARKEKDG